MYYINAKPDLNLRSGFLADRLEASPPTKPFVGNGVGNKGATVDPLQDPKFWKSLQGGNAQRSGKSLPTTPERTPNRTNTRTPQLSRQESGDGGGGGGSPDGGGGHAPTTDPDDHPSWLNKAIHNQHRETVQYWKLVHRVLMHR